MPISIGELQSAFGDFDHVFSNTDDEGKRGRLVLVAGQLDSQLGRILKAYSQFGTEMDQLQETMKPLASFSAKISLCYALGLITSEEKKDLNIVRKIRNQFAHQLYVSFDDQKIKNLVSEMEQYVVTQLDIEKQPAIASVKSHYEEGSPDVKLAYLLKFLSWKMALRIDIASDLQRQNGEGYQGPIP